MISLLFLFVAESVVGALMWHNGSPRSEREHESENPDPAVLCSRRSLNPQKPPVPSEGRSEPARPQKVPPCKQQMKDSTI